MRILLLQDEIYLPSFAGGIKANRCLLEGLARLGHPCMALTPALTKSPDGPRTHEEFLDATASRAITVTAAEQDIFSYEHRGVHVEAFHRTANDQLNQRLVRRIENFRPDWLLVADDKRRTMLDCALTAAGDRVILLLQTIVQLPFGPLAVQQSARQVELMARARAIVVISNFMKRYIDTHSSFCSHVMRLPVYGEGPFPDLGRRDNRFVTMVNPCELKGVSIFLALAREFRDVEFAAVPTWGADDSLIRELQEFPNVCILQPADDIDELLAQTRVLLVPSLWPETFGYVVPEAMLRGIPVLASDIGGLPEAKLGVDYLLAVTPAARSDNGYVGTPQNVAPWARALAELLGEPDIYDRCSRDSRQAALAFVSQNDTVSFETFFEELAATEVRPWPFSPRPNYQRPTISFTRSKPSMQPENAVAVVDPYSSGALLAPEIKRRGYESICVQSTVTIPKMYESSFRPQDFVARIGHEGGIEKTAEQLGALSAQCVLAGCELGVELADQLSERLELVSNGTACSAARRNKWLMMETVRSHGLRTPAQFVSTDLDDLRKKLCAHGRGPVVVKPLQSTGSDSVCLCNSQAEVEAAFEGIMSQNDVFGLTNSGVLVQEYLAGPEYAVDTVSCGGRHRVAAYWRYGKPTRDVPTLGTDSFELLRWNRELHGQLFPFVAGVLDSLEIKHGPAHCEVICADGTPLLVEVGARLNGGQNPVISRYCGGYSQVEMTLDASLTPKRFLADLEQPYRLSEVGMRVFLLPRRTGRLLALPKLSEIESLASYREMHISAKVGRPVSRIAGWVILVHSDKNVIDHDLRRIRDLEASGLYCFEEAAVRN